MSDQIHPRYMTPTFASRSLAATPTQHPKAPQSRSETPASEISTSGTHKKWILSAGKRLGINTPISKKEFRAEGKNSPPKSRIMTPLSFHEARVGTTCSSDVIAAEKMATGKSSPPDKPLPSLPVATVQSESPINRRQLIDAIEKPLRRSISPSLCAGHLEEWPVILPSTSSQKHTASAVTEEKHIGKELTTGSKTTAATTRKEGAGASTAAKSPGPNTIIIGPPPHRQGVRPILRPHGKSGFSVQSSLTQNQHAKSPSGATGFIAVKGTKTSDKENQRSSIPIPTRRARVRVHEDSEGEVLITKPKRGKTANIKEEDRSGEGDVDTDSKQIRRDKLATKFPSLGQQNCSREVINALDWREHPCGIKEQPAADIENTSSFTPPSLPAIRFSSFHNAVGPSPITEKQSELEPLHVVDDDPQYRVKRLSLHAPEYGPTLKILDTADSLIMGPQCSVEIDNATTSSNKRLSAPSNLQSRVTKEQLRKTTEALLKRTNRLPIPRSMTTKSLNKYNEKDGLTMDEERSVLQKAKLKVRRIISNPEIKYSAIQLEGGDQFFELSKAVKGTREGDQNLLRESSDWPLTKTQTCKTSEKLTAEQFLKGDGKSREIPDRFGPIGSFNHSKTYLQTEAFASPGPQGIKPEHHSAELSPQVLASKGMLSGLRKIFHKKSIEGACTSSALIHSKPNRGKNQPPNFNSSPFSSISSSPLSGPKIFVRKRSRDSNITPALRRVQHGRIFKDTATAAGETPEADEAQRATRLAVDVLEKARSTNDSKSRVLLLELGKIMVDATSACRDAEKAMEEAKQAAARAEIHSLTTKKALLEIAQLVGKVLEEE